MNVAAQIALATRQFPDRTAFSDARGVVSFAEFERRSEAVAAHLVDRGLVAGDRVAAFLPNCTEQMILLYAAVRAGGVFVPLNYRFADGDLRFALEDSGALFLAVQTRDLERLLPVVSGTPVRHLLLCGAEPPPPVGGEGGMEMRPIDEIHRSGPSRKVPVAARRDDMDALLMYTSGTTGRPKGVRQTHRNNTASVDMTAAAWQLTAQDRLLQPLPLFHVGGLQCTTLPVLVTGGETRLLARWDPDAWLRELDTFRPTLSGLVTTMLIDVVARLAAQDAPVRGSTLRFCVFGGSATPSHVPQRFEELLQVPLIELYGQTETTGLIATYDVGEGRVAGSMGRVRREVAQAVVIAADGGELPLEPGALGEIAFAGDTVTPGYWRREEETAGRRYGRFLRTGDVVQVGDGGYVRYIDRSDNMIVTGGENVYPAQIESVIARHPQVAEVAVVGTPHERLVQQVTAVVVPSDPALTAEEILAWVAASAEIAPYMRPRRVEIRESLPRTGSGKIHRAQLRESLTN